MTILRGPKTFTHELGPVKFTSLATPSLGTKETALWRIEVPVGSPPTPHSLTAEELFLVLAGSALVGMNDELQTAYEGDVIVVPANVVFTLENAGDEVLKLISCMPIAGQVQMGDMTFTPPWIA
jgi:mannose-6-phosphate isomerase-like protein (cupin superfamily)